MSEDNLQFVRDLVETNLRYWIQLSGGDDTVRSRLGIPTTSPDYQSIDALRKCGSYLADCIAQREWSAADWEAVYAEVRSEVVCYWCKTLPAVCVGAYESQLVEQPACGTCCLHGCEDGYCAPLTTETASRIGRELNEGDGCIDVDTLGNVP